MQFLGVVFVDVCDYRLQEFIDGVEHALDGTGLALAMGDGVIACTPGVCWYCKELSAMNQLLRKKDALPFALAMELPKSGSGLPADSLW